MIKAAGIMFVAPDGRVLFVRRSAGGDHPGEWAFPGGKIEGDETAEQAARREVEEELGTYPDAGGHPLRELARRVSAADGVDFTTFVQAVPDEFSPAKLTEHDAWTWAPREAPPQPLHPGCSIALGREGMTELQVAQAICDGELTSPQCIGSMCLYAMRVTGTGAAYRKSLNEFVWRDPALYLNDEFLVRCNGLPVIWEHTKGAQLDSQEFAERVIGTVLLPYIKGDDVWAICRIYDAEAISLMNEGGLSTSPAVVFADPEINTKLTTDDGKQVLVEGVPTLIDHLAVCALGVWDKGGDPSGIDVKKDSIMNEGEEKVAAADAVRHDADEEKRMDADVGEKLDKMLSCMDALAKRMDAFEESNKKPAEAEEKKDAAGDDAGEVDEPGKPKPVIADKKDADEEGLAIAKKLEEHEKAEDSKKDSVSADELHRIRSEVEKLRGMIPRPRADTERAELAEIQSRADAVYAAFCDSAPRPMDGETPLEYRRRLARKMQKYSDAWKAVELGHLPQSAVLVAETQIYADAMTAARNPQSVDGGSLREVVSTDSTGRKIRNFYGSPKTWMEPFASGTRRVQRIVQSFDN